jgi:hypothetical protein
VGEGCANLASTYIRRKKIFLRAYPLIVFPLPLTGQNELGHVIFLVFQEAGENEEENGYNCLRHIMI